MKDKGIGKWGITAILVIVIVAIAACSAADESGEETEEVISTPVEVASVAFGDLTTTVQLTGTIQADNAVNVIPPLAGKVEERYVSEGDIVEAGDPLVRLDDRDMAYAFEAEQANIQQAQGARQMAQENVEQAEAGVQEARLGLENARTQLEQAKLNLEQGKSGIESAEEMARVSVETAEMQWKEAQQTVEDMEQYRDEEWLSELYNMAVQSEQQARIAYEQAKTEADRAGDTSELDLLELAVSQAETGVQQAQLAVRMAESRKQQAQLEVEQAQVSEAQAGVGLQQAEDTLDDAVITAPIAGEVTNLRVQEGEMLSNQEPLTIIVPRDSLVAQVSLTADQLAMFQLGDEVEVTVNAIGQTLSAEVSEIARTANESGLFPMKALLSEDDVTDDVWDRIRSGMIAALSAEQVVIENEWIIPSRAIMETGEGDYVMVVDGDSARRVDIEILRMDTEESAVRGDFSEEDRVIIRGQHLLEAGDAIRIPGEDSTSQGAESEREAESNNENNAPTGSNANTENEDNTGDENNQVMNADGEENNDENEESNNENGGDA